MLDTKFCILIRRGAVRFFPKGAGSCMVEVWLLQKLPLYFPILTLLYVFV